MMADTEKPTQEATPLPKGRLHRATYSSDKRKGGWLVRVSGPTPNAFVGREVPVTMRDGSEHTEKLTKLIWTGKDAETGDNVALYAFEPRPREDAEQAAF